MTGSRSWLRVVRVIVIAAGVVSVILIVAKSLDPDAYFYYRFQDRSRWHHPTGSVAVIAAFTLLETAIAYIVFGVTRPGRVWARALPALLLLVPWGYTLGAYVIHAPAFYLLHVVWVWLLISCLTLAVLASGAAHGCSALAHRRAHRASQPLSWEGPDRSC